MKIVTIAIANMMCEHCEKKIKSALESLNKFRNITVDYKNKIAVIYASKNEDIQLGLDKIEELGYTPTISKITDL
ncbi:MAG: heavy-metal-associated domain-containing protein [Deltaproteobacteria bacterium]|nr:heavy-metal-associated domain-containing protein [Deltaproteobacteria bacterium]